MVLTFAGFFNHMETVMVIVKVDKVFSQRIKGLYEGHWK
jgi:hypothetical protein